MVDIITARHQHASRRIGKRSLLSMIKLMLMIMTVFLLSTMTGMSTSAESETNDLNSLVLETDRQYVQDENVAAKLIKAETRQYPYPGSMLPSLSLSPSFAGCPLCDSSVYSYCSHKLIHDSCCCNFPGSTIYQKPPQCVYYDCSLLYAKSCNEHGLIKNCCCNNPY